MTSETETAYSEFTNEISQVDLSSQSSVEQIKFAKNPRNVREKLFRDFGKKELIHHYPDAKILLSQIPIPNLTNEVISGLCGVSFIGDNAQELQGLPNFSFYHFVLSEYISTLYIKVGDNFFSLVKDFKYAENLLLVDFTKGSIGITGTGKKEFTSFVYLESFICTIKMICYKIQDFHETHRIKDCAIAPVPCGRNHIGHAIWDEMHAINTFLKNYGDNLDHIPFVRNISGLASLFPVKRLYPEISKKIKKYDNILDLYEQESNKPTLFVRLHDKNFASTETRHRFEKLIKRRVKRRSKVSRNVNESKTLRLGIGLRLQDRCPVNYHLFIKALVLKLNEKFDSVHIIIDGMNSKKYDFNHKDLRKAYSYQITQDPLMLNEYYFTSMLTSMLTGKAQATVQSCVGSTIIENLELLRSCDFVIAPHGAGLAKYRWALDKPCYVLNSKINSRKYKLNELYRDPKYMEEPFAELSFISEEYCRDLKPNKIGVNLKGVGVPLPHNFFIKVNPAVEEVINKIMNSLLLRDEKI